MMHMSSREGKHVLVSAYALHFLAPDVPLAGEYATVHALSSSNFTLLPPVLPLA